MANVANIDLDSLSEVTTIHARTSSKYDIRYSEKTGKFTVSDNAWAKLGLGSRAMKMKNLPDGRVVLNTVADGEGTFLNQKQSKMGVVYTKGHNFTNRKLRAFMDAGELKGVNRIGLVPAGEKDGSPHFLVVEYDEDKGSQLVFTDASEEETPDTADDSSDTSDDTQDAGEDTLTEEETPAAEATTPASDDPFANV